MNLTIFNNETPQEVMDQLRFVLMEFGVVLDVVQNDKESTTYSFTAAKLLDDPEEA
jgi:hypothetical protein